MKKHERKGPLILALESATDVGSVGLYKGNFLMGHTDIKLGRTHARLLLPMIKELLGQLEVKGEELDAIVVSKGPGSYTGLRVGVSTAKGLCMAWDTPLMSLDSLEILAWQASDLARRLDAYICPMIDARRMEVYTAVYSSEIEAKEEIHAHILEQDSFGKYLDEKAVIFVGDGAAKAEDLLGKHPNAIFLPSIHSSTQALGKTLARKFEREDFEDLGSFEPFYLKDFVATKSRDRLRS